MFSDYNVSVSLSMFWIFSNTFQGKVSCHREANYLFPQAGMVSLPNSWHYKVSIIYILTRINQMTVLPALPYGKSKSHFLSKNLASRVETL